MQPLVTIIILNWNGWKDTLECLESIYQINYPNYSVVLVDNHSQDESLQKIREYCEGKLHVTSKYPQQSVEKPIKLIETTPENMVNDYPPEIEPNLVLINNPENYGFAKGNNIGIEYSIKVLDTDYTLLLNNDTVVDRDFLKEMIQVAESDENVGLVGAKIYYYEPSDDKLIWCVGGKIDLEHYPGHYAVMDTLNLIEHEGPTVECDWVSGAAMLIKTKKVPVKYLDESYFFGCEDADLALKLKKHGFTMLTALNANVWHKVASSRRKGSLIRSTCSEISTSLKFIKTHKKNYYRYLPIYIYQILKLYSKWGYTRLFKN
jgi:GT2 family glycosyltransferase